jgi:NodT family efflux transporter outer membrane factor (OMF) lipoprotein
MKNFRHSVNLIGLAVILTGCMVGPDYQQPETTVPQNWVSSQGHQAANDGISLEQSWWENFHDPVLNQLINKALNANPDIKTAETRIASARASRASASAALLPTGDLMGSANRQGNQLGFPSGGPANLSSLVKEPFSIFKSGFDASWELDLFGGHRRELESAEAELTASAISREDVFISTLAEVAKTYVEIRQYQVQLQNAMDTIDADNKSAAITRQRAEVGDTARIDVSYAESRLEHDQAQIAYFSNLLSQAEYSLDVLLGEKPGITHDLVGAGSVVPLSDKQLILAAPAMVIANRPDIRNAERKLAAATAQQGVAVAKFFPDVSLSGFIGLFNTNAANFLNLSSKSWSMGASVLWPILSYGALSANLDAADAKQQEALAIYQKSILSALSDVERSFTAYIEQEKYMQAEEKAVAADQHVCVIAKERYNEGLTSLQDVLDAQRSLYASRTQLISAKAQTSQNFIAVYKSLGGSWKPAASN